MYIGIGAVDAAWSSRVYLRRSAFVHCPTCRSITTPSSSISSTKYNTAELDTTGASLQLVQR